MHILISSNLSFCWHQKKVCNLILLGNYGKVTWTFCRQKYYPASLFRIKQWAQEAQPKEINDLSFNIVS